MRVAFGLRFTKTMTKMKFNFKVTQTDTFSKIIEIEAENEEQAREQLTKDLEACPLDTRSGTFEDSNIDVEPE